MLVTVLHLRLFMQFLIAFDEGERKPNIGLWFSIAGVLYTVIDRKIPHSFKVTKMCPPLKGGDS